jgi:hypothetical protein
MRVRTFPAKLLSAAALMILVLSACGGDDATPAESDSDQPTSAASTVTSPATPTQTVTLPTSTPTQTAPVVLPATPTVIPKIAETPAQSPTATPEVRPASTSTLVPATPSGPTPVPQTAALQLDVIFPPEDLVVDTETITVTGIASPDATVSVNGNLAVPNAEGRFSLELTLSPDENPLAIEVIATSVAGEELTVVRTVIFVP